LKSDFNFGLKVFNFGASCRADFNPSTAKETSMFFPATLTGLSVLVLLFAPEVSLRQTTAQVPAQKSLLKGKVLDQNHDAIPGAKITVNRNDSRFHVSTLTDEHGDFALAVDPGLFEVSAIAQGFSGVTQTVNLKPDNPLLFEIVLNVADASAVVTISDTASYLTEAVISATKTTTLLRDIPQSITVVSKDQIKEQSMQSIADVIAYVPGIISHQGENNRDQLILRGNSSSADFFLNGVRDDVQYYRDLYNVERVEALKGPNSMIFGRGGGGGVVNRVTKEAGFSTVREIAAQLGSFGNKRFTTDINRPFNNKVSFRTNGLYENSNSFRQYVNLERYGINPTLTLVPGANTRIAFAYEFFHDNRIADRGVPSFAGRPADTPIATFFGDPSNSRVQARVNLASATIDHHAGRLVIHNRTMFGDYKRFYQNYVPGTVTADKTQVVLSAYNNATKRRNLFNQTDTSFTVSTGRISHNLLTGAELGLQLTDNLRNTGFFNNTATSILVPYDNPTISRPVTFRQNAADANNHLKTNLAATYLQDQIEIGRHVQLVTGLRFDYFDLRFHNNRTGQDLRRIDRLVSPRAGVIIKPGTDISIYLNYGVAYLPSSGDQFSSLTSITQQAKPEKFINYELGAKWDVAQNLSLTMALYRQDRNNTRATDPNDTTRIVQTGSQRTNGYELGLNGAVTKRWSIAGGYAYQDAFISSDTVAARAGAQVAQVPHRTVSLWNNYRVLRRLALGLGIIHRADMFAAIDNTVVLPGYTRADAGIFFSLNERWRLQANVQNLFDTNYYINADNNTNISPGSPRGVRLGLIARF
jgi:catecholate siderophore receptor